MNLQRYMMLRALKDLLVDGRDETANLVAGEIAGDILAKDCPVTEGEVPGERHLVAKIAVPKIIQEARSQLRLADWEEDESEGGRAA